MKNYQFKVRPGFIVYRNGPGPVYVCQHTGPAFEAPEFRDDNSDVVASLCWKKTGGTLIFSTTPRRRIFGIDFNRDKPPMDSAILMWKEFQKGDNQRTENFRNQYAWVAKDAADHRTRSKIYGDFWREVKTSGNVVIFFHRQFTSLPNFPSLMELITYQGEWVEKNLVKAIVESINNNQKDFFEGITNHYKHNVLLEELRFLDKVRRKTGRLEMGGLKPGERKRLEDDLKIIESISGVETAGRLRKNLDEREFAAAIKSVLRTETRPQLTVENRFLGDKALKRKKQVLGKNSVAMEIESSSFINYWYPRLARDMTIDLFNDLISADIYEKMTRQQTQLSKFLNLEG